MVEELFEKLVSNVREYLPEPDESLLRRACDFGTEVHNGHVRASGDPYIEHPLNTAIIASKLQLDLPSITAAILHDTVNSHVVASPVENQELEKQFGKEISEIVSGVWLLTEMEFDERRERQVESFRMMLVALARDIRVVLIKLCDRLHVMRTLGWASEITQQKIAAETRDIYAPLANRLGIHWLKSELEDLCLFYQRPEIYRGIFESFGKDAEERKAFIAETTAQIKEILNQSGVTASVTGRAKHFFSVWQKMEKNNLRFEEIHDLLGFRVIVPTVRSCYESLGIIHSTWKPVPNRFKDYIAMPKSNMYQSLHTTVVGPAGQRIEVQIRTPEMNQIAEEGIAAHWRYKERFSLSADFDLKWVKELIDDKQYLKNPEEFIQSVKGDFFPEQVIVFTPKGDIVRLPYGSTVIDFAYSVHSDVGSTTIGSKVNGQMVPLHHKLQNGDTIEVFTSKKQKPKKSWISFARSSKAKQRIRSFLREEERAISIAKGQDMVVQDLKKHKKSFKQLLKSGAFTTAMTDLGYKSQEDLFAAVAYGKLDLSKVTHCFLDDEAHGTPPQKSQPSALERIFDRAASVSRDKVGIVVSGLDNIVVRFAKCCEPLPGDPVIGFISRGRGVTVHHSDCAFVKQFDSMRLVEVAWNTDIDTQRNVTITVHSQDQLGLLAKMLDAISNNGADIRSAKCATSEFGKVVNVFQLTIKDAKQLSRIKRALEMVPGVTRVDRVSHSWHQLDVREVKT